MTGMAKKKEATKAAEDGAVVKAAKAIGEAAGKVAAAVSVATSAKHRVPKFEKKNKGRLPRKQKKVAGKASKQGA
jgi:hypothetical protein